MSVRILSELRICWSKTQFDVNSAHGATFANRQLQSGGDGIYEKTLNTRIGSGKPWQNRPDSGESGETYI